MAIRSRVSQGFALPTILLASTLMMIVLVVSVSAMTSVNVSMNSQYVDQLAREAAESGLARAADCVRQNSGIPQWGSNALYPTSKCDGTSATYCPLFTDYANAGWNGFLYDSACNIVGKDNASSRLYTTFSVQPVTVSGNNTITATGTSVLLRSDNTPVASSRHSVTLSSRISTLVGANQVAFGYSSCGTYFLTLGQDGIGRGLGANTCGQLGNGDLNNTVVPRSVVLPAGVQISNGATQSIFSNFLNVGLSVGVIGTDGNAYFSGPDSNGQLGNGSPASATPPASFVKFNLPAGKTAKYLAPIGTNNYVITNDGYVYAAGSCDSGTLGNGTSGSGCTDAASPVQLTIGAGYLPTPSLSNPSTIPIAITGDSSSRHLLMADGSVYGWGQGGIGGAGSLGGALAVNSAMTAIVSRPTKTVVYGTSAFGAGGTSMCQYGVTTTSRCIVDVQETGRNTYVLANDGTVWAAGDNTYGMIGQPSSIASTSVFRQVTLPAGDTVAKQISADAWQGVVLTTNGNVYTMGLNKGASGVRGGGAGGCGTPVAGSPTCPFDTSAPITINGTSVNLVKFLLPASIQGTFISNTSIGNDGLNMATYVIGSDKNIYGAGDNTYGQLGNSCGKSSYMVSSPTTAFHSASPPACSSLVGQPVLMDTFSDSAIIPQTIQSGRSTAVVRTTAGQVYTVGYNDAGQLGDGTTNANSTPQANRYTNTVPITIY